MGMEITPSEEMFKKNEKMEPILDYVMEHLLDGVNITRLCEEFHFSENTISRKFKNHYGVTCERFIMMLRMRAAAEELSSDNTLFTIDLVDKYGFSNISSFSKAFKREIGVSPKIFQKSGKSIPDMPLPKSFNGHKLYFKYMKVDDFDAYGYKVPLIHGVYTDLLKECAYPLEHGSEYLDLYGNKDQIGFWWSDVKDKLFYILGYKMYSIHDVPEDAKVFHFDGSDYAVFSVERSDDLEETLLAHRMMVYYVMMVWQRINNKIGNKMTYTYEVFGKHYTYIYLPLLRGMPREESEDASYSTGLDDWIKYIDQHIKEELLLEDVAAHFNYSKRHFCRVFKNYFTYSASEYIRKKRLYLAARDVRDVADKNKKDVVVRAYRFIDYDDFYDYFREEYQIEPKDYSKISFYVPNLTQYYSSHKNQIKIRVMDIEEIKMIGRTIQARDVSDDLQDNIDIPDLASYWLRNDPDDLKGTKYECLQKGEEDKLALWYSDTKSGTNEYILGPLVERFDDAPEGYRQITIPAGKYAVIESLSEVDDGNMTNTYRMISRCAYGWIKEYQYRVNLDKLTFVRYIGRKLFFYIPVYE